MELKPGAKVKHKLTGEKIMILEVGPKAKDVLVPGYGNRKQDYLANGIVRVRLPNMTIVDVYDYEIEGIDPIPETGRKSLLMES